MSTTDTTADAPPAGWYPDPSGRHERRWWDGEAWTTQVADRAEGAEGGEPLDDVEPTPVDEPVEEADPMAEVGEQRAGQLPPEERASTGAGLKNGPSRTAMVLVMVGVVAIVGLALWGYDNHTSANHWQDRSEQLREELSTGSSNAETLDQADRANGRRVSRQQLNELRGAALATADHLDTCRAVLDDLAATASDGGDTGPGIAQAQEACGTAGGNSAALSELLDQLDPPG